MRARVLIGMIADASLGSSGWIATKPFIAHEEGNFPSLRNRLNLQIARSGISALTVCCDRGDEENAVRGVVRMTLTPRSSLP
jgi:hypothetical protein